MPVKIDQPMAQKNKSFAKSGQNDQKYGLMYALQAYHIKNIEIKTRACENRPTDATKKVKVSPNQVNMRRNMDL